MLPDFEPRLRAFAEVIVRVGLNLQRGQRLLFAEPYELQGVARSAEIITSLGRAGRLFYHPLFDENARSHVALGRSLPLLPTAARRWGAQSQSGAR